MEEKNKNRSKLGRLRASRHLASISVSIIILLLVTPGAIQAGRSRQRHSQEGAHEAKEKLQIEEFISKNGKQKENLVTFTTEFQGPLVTPSPYTFIPEELIEQLYQIQGLESFKIWFGIGRLFDSFSASQTTSETQPGSNRVHGISWISSEGWRPDFGSFITVKCKKSEKSKKPKTEANQASLDTLCAKRVGYLLAGLLDFSNERFIDVEKYTKNQSKFNQGNEQSEEDEQTETFFYGSSQEIFCQHHLYKIRKLFPDLINPAMKIFFQETILSEKYAGFGMEFSKRSEVAREVEGQTKSGQNTQKRFKVRYELTALFKKNSATWNSIISNSKQIEYTPYLEQSLFVNRVGNKVGKILVKKPKIGSFGGNSDSEEAGNGIATLHSLLVRAKDNFESRETFESNQSNFLLETPKVVKIGSRRYSAGVNNIPEKEMIAEYWAYTPQYTQNAKTLKKCKTADLSLKSNKNSNCFSAVVHLTFGYTQRPWISTLSVFSIDQKRYLTPEEYDFSYSSENHKKKANPWPSLQIAVKFNFEPLSVLSGYRVSIKYGVSLHGYEQLEHEAERGAYAPVALYTAKELGGGEGSVELPVSSDLNDQKKMDNTYVFVTLTTGLIVMGLLHGPLSVWGMTGKMAEMEG